MLGKKAENLRILREHGFPVPEFITVSKNMDSRKLIIPWETCAVRSCAAVEDGADKSFAGQFDTYLNVKRADAHAMIDKCFASMEKDNVKEYASAKGISFSDSDLRKKKAAIRKENPIPHRDGALQDTLRWQSVSRSVGTELPPPLLLPR